MQPGAPSTIDQIPIPVSPPAKIAFGGRACCMVGYMGTKERGPDYWIEKLGLREHPEGGYYRRTYEARETVSEEALPGRFDGDRVLGTAIYYLLPRESPSRFHRIKSDELWHFYTGGPAVVYVISADGKRTDRFLGPDPDRGQCFQAVIPHGSWFAAEVLEGGFSLFGCTVSPGFAFEDLELGDGGVLLKQYPNHRRLIERLTPAG